MKKNVMMLAVSTACLVLLGIACSSNTIPTAPAATPTPVPPTNTPVITSTPSSTRTSTATGTATGTPTLTATSTSTATPTATFPAGTNSPTPVPTSTPTATPTSTGTGTPTATVTSTATGVGPGSVAFTGIVSNGNSSVAFVAPNGLPANQVIYFTNDSYDATVPGLVDESTTSATAASTWTGQSAPTTWESIATTIVEGIISYTAPTTGLGANVQVVFGKSVTTGGLLNVTSGTVANVAGAGGFNYLTLNHNGAGHKVLAFAVPSAGVTTYLGALMFGPDTWTTTGTIPALNFWDSYLPPGLTSSTSIDLSSLWATDNLNVDNTSTTQNDNAVLNSCQTTLAGIVNPSNWAADGNQAKTAVNLYPPIVLTPCASSGGFTGTLP